MKMPDPLPISQAIIESIEDLRDQSRLAGFDDGYHVGYEAGFSAALNQIRAKLGAIEPTKSKSFVDVVREDMGLVDEPAPIRELMGWVITDENADRPRKKRLVSVKDLGLSTKTTNALVGAGITKVKQLTEMSPAELRKLPRIGAGSVKEIATVLKKHGKSLKA
jgi:DNA-directed RNA polymerase alpha subunit